MYKQQSWYCFLAMWSVTHFEIYLAEHKKWPTNFANYQPQKHVDQKVTMQQSQFPLTISVFSERTTVLIQLLQTLICNAAWWIQLSVYYTLSEIPDTQHSCDYQLWHFKGSRLTLHLPEIKVLSFRSLFLAYLVSSLLWLQRFLKCFMICGLYVTVLMRTNTTFPR